MLSLIPAVLMLILQGPTGLEQARVDGRLAEALRVWAARQSVRAPSGLTELAEQGGPEFESLLQIGQESPEFSRFLAEVLQFAACSAQPVQESSAVDFRPESHRAELSVGVPARGFLDSSRSRDGPSNAPA